MIIVPEKMKSLRTPLLIAGAFVLVFWVVALGQAERSVFGRVPILDEVYYLDRAAEISGATTGVAEPWFMSPLYPHLVAAAGAGGGVPEDRVFDGTPLRGLRLLQICCWLGTLVLIRLLAAHVVPPSWQGRERTAALWLPVVLFGLYRPAAVYAMAVLLETPLLFLATLALYLMVQPKWSSGRALLLGLALGLAVLLRGTTMLLLPVALGTVWWQRKANSRCWLKAALLLLGLALAVAPAVVHNSRLAGRLVGPALNGGVNLYIGNGPEANGFYVAAVPGDWRHDPAGRAFLAERFDMPQVSLVQADEMWAAEARHHMGQEPGRIAGLMLRKIWLQLQGWEIDQLTSLAGWTAQVPALKVLVTPYALLVVLGMAGLVGNRRVAIMAAVLLVLVLGQSLFFVVSRYRLILVPIWSVLAGLGAVQLWRRRRLALVVAAVALVLAVPWGLNDVRENWAALAQANEALRWADVGRAEGSVESLERAEKLYRKSVVVAGSRSPSWLGLAAVLNDLGRPGEAADALREGLTRATPLIGLRKALLAHELAGDNLREALVQARAILQEEPEDAETLHNLVVLLSRVGKAEEALAHARKLREFHPRNFQGHLDVGVLLARSGRHQEAKAAFYNGLQHCPDNEALLHNLSLIP